MEDFWRMYGRFMEDYCKIYGGFMEDLCKIYGGFMQDLWRIYGGFMSDLWRMYARFMEDLWMIYGGFMENLWFHVATHWNFECWPVFRILTFEFRILPRTTENQWKPTKIMKPKKNNRNTQENQWTKTMITKTQQINNYLRLKHKKENRRKAMKTTKNKWKPVNNKRHNWWQPKKT